MLLVTDDDAASGWRPRRRSHVSRFRRSSRFWPGRTSRRRARVFAARASPAAATDGLTGSADEAMVETLEPPPDARSERLGVHERLARLTIVDRLKTAMRSSREERPSHP
jgi:hypothetical protein